MKKQGQNTDHVWKRRVFTIIAASIPVVVFALVEGGLRLAGYGSDAPLFVPIEGLDGYLRSNDSVAVRYFVSEATLPTIPLEVFRAEKTDSTIRIVVQGGSSAAGFPYYFGTSLADELEPVMTDLLPGKDVQVISTAMAAVNTFTLLDLSDDILALRPDLILIYAGHNEYYGALGVGSSQSFGRSARMKRWYLRLRRLRTVQALRNGIAGLLSKTSGHERGRPPGVTLMERMVGEQSIPYGSEAYEDGVGQFRSNLRALLAKYADRGIPVVIGTLASNVRDQAPFVDGAEPGHDTKRLDEAVAEAESAAARGDTASAVEKLSEVVSRDSIYASARYALGRLLLHGGQAERGRELLYGAKDRDELRFRAVEEMNRIIEQSVDNEHVFLADVQRVMAEATANGLPDSTVMTEHLHPNVRGYRLLTQAFVQAITRAGLFGLSPATEIHYRNVTRLDSLVGALRLVRLKGSWPFKPPGSRTTELTETQTGSVEEKLALDVLNEKKDRTEALAELGKYYLSEHRFTDARDASLAIAERFPFMGRPLVDAGDAAVSMGKPKDALKYYRKSLEREESGAAHRMIGALVLQQGKHEEAISQLRRSLELEPGNPQSLYNLAGALALSGRLEEARAVCDTLLAKYPGHEQGRKLLESLRR
ncbi:MAG: tetratricopeptide repeat protein [Rhodothermales bacterium]